MSIASIKAKIAELEVDAANYEAAVAQETAITRATSGTITINEETFLTDGAEFIDVRDEKITSLRSSQESLIRSMETLCDEIMALLTEL
jgi:hypothetical protein